MKTIICPCAQSEDGTEVVTAGITDAEATFYGVYTVDEAGNCLDLICDLETRERAEIFERGFQAGFNDGWSGAVHQVAFGKSVAVSAPLQ